MTDYDYYRAAWMIYGLVTGTMLGYVIGYYWGYPKVADYICRECEMGYCESCTKGKCICLHNREIW